MSPAEEYRAEYVGYARSLKEAADNRAWKRLTKAHPIPPERREVRIVGSKFLPDPNEEMEFDRIAKGNAGPFNSVLASVVAFIDQSVVSTAAAGESEEEAKGDRVQTAGL